MYILRMKESRPVRAVHQSAHYSQCQTNKQNTAPAVPGTAGAAPGGRKTGQFVSCSNRSTLFDEKCVGFFWNQNISSKIPYESEIHSDKFPSQNCLQGQNKLQNNYYVDIYRTEDKYVVCQESNDTECVARQLATL